MNAQIITRGAALLGVTALSLLGPAGPAKALTVDMTCSVSIEGDLDPALTSSNNTASVTVRAAATGCLPLTPAAAGLFSAAITGTGIAHSESAVPCALLTRADGSGVINWNTGAQSNFTFLLSTNILTGVLAANVMITSGPLAGDQVTGVPVVAHPNPDCALVGLTRVTAELGQVFIGHA